MLEDKMEKFRELNEYVHHIARDLFNKARILLWDYAEACLMKDDFFCGLGPSEWKEAQANEMLSFELFRMAEEMLE